MEAKGALSSRLDLKIFTGHQCQNMDIYGYDFTGSECFPLPLSDNKGVLTDDFAELIRELRINGLGILTERFAAPEKSHHIQPPFAI
jgi:hypothetical protein